MAVYCCKIKVQLQGDEEETVARRAVRGTGVGHRKGEVECAEDNLCVSGSSGGGAEGGVLRLIMHSPCAA